MGASESSPRGTFFSVTKFEPVEPPGFGRLGSSVGTQCAEPSQRRMHAILVMPGRRIGQCWGATRAPFQVRKRGRAAQRRPLISRFWPNAINPRGSGGRVPQVKNTVVSPLFPRCGWALVNNSATDERWRNSRTSCTSSISDTRVPDSCLRRLGFISRPATRIRRVVPPSIRFGS
jgi:hypothetical protein